MNSLSHQKFQDKTSPFKYPLASNINRKWFKDDKEDTSEENSEENTETGHELDDHFN